MYLIWPIGCITTMHDMTGIEVEVAKFQVAKSAVLSLVFG